MSNLLMDFDKAGAEWVVVAYLSGDENMLQVIANGESPHVATGHLITGAPKELISLEDRILDKTTDPDELMRVRSATPELSPLLGLPFLPRSMTIRQAGKKSNHGLNYGMKYRRFALENEIPEAEAADLVTLYSTVAYPRISEWWRDVQGTLRKDNRTLTNCFGRKVRLLGEWGAELFDKAYSFVPQSTVGDTVNRAILGAYEDVSPVFREADLLVQRHDSATYQYPIDHTWGIESAAAFAVEFGLGYMNPELEYNGRKFHIGTDLKIGFDMGNLVKVKLTDAAGAVAAELRRAVEVLTMVRGAEKELAGKAAQSTPAVGAPASEARAGAVVGLALEI